MVTRKVTDGYPATKGTDPETELSGTKGSPYGRLVCTGRGGRWFTHGVGYAYTPCSLVSPRARHGASSVANRLSDDAQPQSQRGKVASFPKAPRVSPEGRATHGGALAAPYSSKFQMATRSCPCGLWPSLRHYDFSAKKTASTPTRQISWASVTHLGPFQSGVSALVRYGNGASLASILMKVSCGFILHTPRGLLASMCHPVCLRQRRVSSGHRDRVTSSLFGATVCMEIAQSLRCFVQVVGVPVVVCTRVRDARPTCGYRKLT